MWWQLAVVANLVISLAYFAICYAILAPLVRERQLRSNRLGAATAAIFFSCAVGHGMHAAHPLLASFGDRSALAQASRVVPWHEAIWDALTASVGVYYWTLRRTYGSLMRGAALFHDLEQQRLAQELESRQALAQARDLFAGVLDAATEQLIIGTDVAGRVTVFNVGAQRMLGYSAEEMLGRIPIELHDWSEIEARAAELGIEPGPAVFTKPLGKHRSDSRQWSYFTRDRVRLQVMLTVTAMRDGTGAVTGYIVVGSDVTEQRRAEAELEKARDMALEASRQKSAFLATMSHEIRTPMNAVIGMTGLLLDTALDADQREFVETVRSSGDSLLAIINNILDFSKIEAGGLELERRPFDLRDCVDAAVDVVAATSSSKGYELVVDVEPRCPTEVVGDINRLSQVLVNLLGNAAKFTSEGEVLLSVELVEGAGAPSRLRFAVTDTGIGIPEDRLESLFDSFTQVDASTTRVYGGTGLGLAISQRLVEAMGGVLAVESTSGVGSAFSFSVRLDPVETVAPSPPPRSAAELQGRSVLVVDDNATSRRMLRIQMEAWGMDVTEASSGPAATALIALGESYDIGLVDMQMPGMTGQQLADYLRSCQPPVLFPLVLLSSREDRRDPDGEALFAAVLTKPVRSRRLHHSLRQALLPAAGEPVPLTPAAVGTAAERHSLRVLLAEDNVVNQRLGRLLLEKLGCHVDVVGNGAEATRAVQLAAYDVVLMDVEMPEMDGLEATRVIRRELPRPRQPRIVALTASVLVQDQKACVDAGMDDYLAKPVRLGDLEAALGKAEVHIAPPPEIVGAHAGTT